VPANQPYIETEVKIRFPQGPDAARQRIENSGFKLKQDRTLESDQLFDRGDGELRRADQLLRLRREGNLATATYKGPGRSERHKSREEIEFEVSNPANFHQVLERLGYTPRFRYEKYRTKFAASGEPGIVTIDETPIGVFLELEGPAQWIDRTAARLGLSEAEYLTHSYAALYQEYRRSNPHAPPDMIFQGKVGL
jgi:adenylate cyclase class 2